MSKIKLFLKEKWADINWKNQVRIAVKNSKKCALEKSYYPEFERKTEKTRISENIHSAKQFGEPNEFYTLYGLDIIGSEPSKYIDYWSFMVTRNQANKMGRLDSQLVILRDKFMFFKFMQSCNIPVANVFAVFKNGVLYDSELNKIEWNTIYDKEDYFIKSVDGECASFVRHVKNCTELEKVKNDFEQTGMYIFQEKVKQAAEMDVINPYAINTYRIITINKNGNVYVLSAILRVGTKKTGNVDNWAAGGLAIGINGDGHLKKYGFYKPVYGGKIDIHPDTSVVFSEFLAPKYKEALDLVCRAHKQLYGIRAIGWDVAISENGPLLIEGNDNFEISLNQVCDRPLREEWEKVIS